ncbi:MULTISPECIES: PTS mannose/fructose/sorbose/N-acetylgalactosamine transporter subunit IIC [Aerococcus]|uniref:PTS mannose/fructose/sorbose/N-acetylgalactosamine transporter subunit IIC n=1 Tax=Aerococcus urinae (strain CCUG 59500 / ACS-120-V-Col10a) TaxID=2976812 RepID=UPI000200FD50|nr:PTS sugar transporter subunit IIC [Aerococcus sp. Group 1]AEA01601.1 PTS system sorbose-specific iic component [Aerococcus sp. Group 1]MCY3031162.1 PTS sugar transporter subunit IIC [Aerococcus sp. Group 1]MCY3054201.1 PTS sugar transporter subunit IIC [Aerococcus sp. Group 1]MCY3055931.1 PTS sugar transporter subunit IIC [Aerococcus sp. Group 1]MCY3061921.1 PTS sugar transporter subunit IIC [Aerococcus sp. Group 1]
MLLQAFIVAFVVFITVGGQELLGFTMLGRPIVIGPLLGLLLGDLQTGLLIGASLETIFMGVVNIGGASSAEPGLATALATAFAINMGAGVDIVLPIAIPLGIIGLQIKTLIYVGIVGPFATKFDQLAEQGNAKKIAVLHYGLWFLQWFIYALIPFFAILYGAELTQHALEQIPDVIVHGLSIAGNLLPAVGMAMLLKILWDKHLFIYFLLGFVLISYFKIPLITVAVIAAIIAVIVSYNDMKLKRMNDKNQATSPVNVNTTDKELDQFFN